MDDETRPDRLGEFLDGNLSGDERAAFEAELAGDPELAAEAARLEKLTGLIERLPEERDVPAEVNVRILDAIAAERAAKESRGAVVAGPGSGQRARSIFSAPTLGWAAAAAALLVAALVWYVNRPEPVGPDGPGARQMATLQQGLRVGRPIANAEYRIFDADFGHIYHALRLGGRRAAISYNNLRVPVDSPYRRVQSDDDGHLAFGEEFPGGTRVVSVDKPGHLRSWGLLERRSGEAAPAGGMVAVTQLFPGDEVTLSGRVTDAGSGQPVADAMVTTPDGSGVLVTNAEGEFRGTITVVQEGEVRLFVCARGYATGIRPLKREKLLVGEWSGDVQLVPALRYDVGFTVVDQAGTPLSGAVVLAIACEQSAPEHRAGRPELAIADKNGKVRLWQLRECPYRLEVHHKNADFAPIDLDVAAPPARIEARPAGAAGLAIRMVAADGSKLGRGHVMLSHANEVEGQMRHVDFDPAGEARFKNVEGGANTMRVVTGDGIGYVIEFDMAPDAELAVPYRLPDATHTVTGRLAPDLVGKVLMLRLEAELEPVVIGGQRSRKHRVVAEVDVRDGVFRFPPLPRCRVTKIAGFTSQWKPTELEADAALAAGLAADATDKIEITLKR